MRTESMPHYRRVPRLWIVIGLVALPAVVALLALAAQLGEGAGLGLVGGAAALDDHQVIAPFRWA